MSNETAWEKAAEARGTTDSERALALKQHADSTRRFHDYSCAFLVVFFNFVGFVAALRSYPDVFTLTGWPIVIYVASVIASIYLVMRSTVRPHRF